MQILQQIKLLSKLGFQFSTMHMSISNMKEQGLEVTEHHHKTHILSLPIKKKHLSKQRKG